MEQLGYKDFGDYVIFTNKPTTRVYLGDCKIDDYISDEENQEKRSKSCYYYNIKTNEKVSKKEAFSHGTDILYHEDDSTDKENYTYGFKCDFDFERKTSFAYMFSNHRKCSYNQNDKNAEKLAKSFFFNMTLEELDKIEKDAEKLAGSFLTSEFITLS